MGEVNSIRTNIIHYETGSYAKIVIALSTGGLELTQGIPCLLLLQILWTSNWEVLNPIYASETISLSRAYF